MCGAVMKTVWLVYAYNPRERNDRAQRVAAVCVSREIAENMAATKREQSRKEWIGLEYYTEEMQLLEDEA